MMGRCQWLVQMTFSFGEFCLFSVGIRECTKGGWDPSACKWLVWNSTFALFMSLLRGWILPVHHLLKGAKNDDFFVPTCLYDVYTRDMNFAHVKSMAWIVGGNNFPKKTVHFSSGLRLMVNNFFLQKAPIFSAHFWIYP